MARLTLAEWCAIARADEQAAGFSWQRERGQQDRWALVERPGGDDGSSLARARPRRTPGRPGPSTGQSRGS